MVSRLIALLAALFFAVFPSQAAETQSSPVDRKEEYVRAVTRGAGLMPWQQPGVSAAERQFRDEIEHRKIEMLAARVPVRHPVLIDADALEQARRHIASADWAREWAEQNRSLADYIAAQPPGYVERMIPQLTPTNTYGFTCPNCVGVKSQEGMGRSLMGWDYRKPEVCACKRCGQVYPSDDYPETATLQCPRSNQSFTHYLNDAERANPDDRSGSLAYHWVSRPIHVSFTGQIRAAKVAFMIEASRTLALQYGLSGEPRYASTARDVLVRLAHCYRNWLYHDYWDTVADCDPMYAAWHDKKLPLEWKRHLCEQAFARDSGKSAAMLQNYWGAGRIHPSTDSIENLATLALAYDLIHDAADVAGEPIWTPGQREKVERDLLLEYAMGAEPFIGGAGQADAVNNKTPRVYHALAAVGRSLGLANYVDVALRGYEGVRDRSFLYDGFSRESPSYTNMYLSSLVQVPETLHGFTWPSGFPGRQGSVDVFGSDARLRLMFRAMRDQLQPDGGYPPLSDTNQGSRPSVHLVDMGLRRYPEYFRGQMPGPKRSPSPSSLFQYVPASEAAANDSDLSLPELLFPAWMTAFLRHGDGPDAAMVAMPFNPEGGHRHADNLALFYRDGGQLILGDHGYVGDMPVNSWIKSTFSHNLVIVDDAEQRTKGRRPRFVRMFTSPRVSVIEAASDCYAQCGEYSRLIALIKGPGGRTFAVDIFRVKGGRKHDYRVFSEIASSDAAQGALAFAGVDLPPEPPLPEVGASLAKADIFGLRDVRSAAKPPAEWQAVWQERGRSYRLWMVSECDRVEASNGPGQQALSQPGRRVRYVDAVLEGENLASTFVALHEPSDHEGAMAVRRVERLPVSPSAGPDAVALQIESDWGTYTLLNRFPSPAEVGGIRFQGQFALLHERAGQQWLIAHESAGFSNGRISFDKITPVWTGKVLKHTDDLITTDSPRPDGWPDGASGIQQYVTIRTADQETGMPVRRADENTIQIERFPLSAATEFRLPSLVVAEK